MAIKNGKFPRLFRILKNLCETSSLAIVENVPWEKYFNI
jgi:hypothetical protein